MRGGGVLITNYSLYWDNALYHHGVKGQKWGIRRFQNPDGTRTNAGKRRRKTTTGQVAKYIGSQALNVYATLRLIDNASHFLTKTIFETPISNVMLAVGGPYGQMAMAIFGALSAAGFLAAGVDTVTKAVKDHKKFKQSKG